MKRWLRNWLGIQAVVTRVIEIEERQLVAEDGARGQLNATTEVCKDIVGIFRRLDAHEDLHRSSFSKSNDLQSALQEIRQIRETVLDPKKVPIATRNSRQFRALVEQDAG